MTVLVVAESHGAELRPVSLELVSAGRKVANELDQPLVAALAGSNIGSAAAELARSGVDRVLVADQPDLESLTAERATAAAVAVVKLVDANVVLIPGTTSGRDYAPRFAARLNTGIAADASDLSIEGARLVAVRPILGGRVLTAVKLTGDGTQIVTVRPGAFEPAKTTAESVPIDSISVELTPDDLRVTVKNLLTESGGAVASLEAADVIVSGGRGLKEPENFKLVEELAGALDAAVGASRAVVDAGWRPHHEQVGQTGRTVSPKLYIAVGISGAVQHLVGMQGSEYIIAINRDPDAPIFKIASFGIVGDLFEIVPAIVAELSAARS